MRAAYSIVYGWYDLFSVTLFDMPNTKSVGEVSEAIILAEFLKAGFPVLLPFGDNQRYDMVVEVGGRFLRVQCKTASLCGWKDGHRTRGSSCIRFSAHSGVFGPGDRVTSRAQPYRGEADLFAAYSPDTKQVYVLPVDECPVTDVWLRLTPAKNNQQIGIRLAEKHTLAAWAARQGGSVMSSPSGVLPAAGRL